MKASLRWSADFETTTDKDDCRVWAFALSNIANPKDFRYGTTIDEFIDFCKNPKENYEMYFFNLKFDGSYLISFLLRSNYTWIKDKKDKASNTFTTLITDNGAFYEIVIYFEVYGHKTNKVVIRDAMKIFPNFSVERLAQGFGLEISKLELDYHEKRAIGHVLTKEEVDYIRNDVEIVAWALKAMFDRGYTKMTIASNAMADMKARTPYFRRYFPKLPDDVDADIRRSYKGGFTYVNSKYAGVRQGEGICLDVNSLYPSTMLFKKMPVSYPMYFEGKYEHDPTYDLYIQTFSCIFELKENKIPSIQIKHSLDFMANEYLTSSNDEEVVLTLTNPDLELFFEQYNVSKVKYIGGWKFQGRYHIFDNYINYWMNEKIQAGKEGNKPRKLLAKLYLNSAYGRFAIATKGRQKMPIIDQDGVVHYSTLAEESRSSLYLPVATFVTSYARCKTIRSSQAVRDYSMKKYGVDKYWYSDTDSIWGGLNDEDLEALKDVIEIDDFEIGKWALEKRCERFIALRQKCYIYQVDGKVQVTIAGLPQYLAPLITFDNFKQGFTTAGMSLEALKEQARKNGASEEEIKKIHHKLRYTYVNGGVILTDTDFTIK